MSKMMVTLSSRASSLTQAVFGGLRCSFRFTARLAFATICLTVLNACESSTPANASNSASNSSNEGASLVTATIDIELRDASLLLSAVLSNDSDQALVFLPWGTPFEGAVTADFLSIRKVSDSSEVPYIGIMVKRVAPSPEDYVTVEAGKSLVAMADISKSYDFCANTEYQIAYSQTLSSLDAKSYSVQSNTVTVVTSDDFKACP